MDANDSMSMIIASNIKAWFISMIYQLTNTIRGYKNYFMQNYVTILPYICMTEHDRR